MPAPGSRRASTEAVIARLEAVLMALRDQVRASRVTLRLDAPGRGFHVDDVAAEAHTAGVRSLRRQTSIDQRAAGTIQWLERAPRPRPGRPPGSRAGSSRGARRALRHHRADAGPAGPRRRWLAGCPCTTTTARAAGRRSTSRRSRRPSRRCSGCWTPRAEPHPSRAVPNASRRRPAAHSSSWISVGDHSRGSPATCTETIPTMRPPSTSGASISARTP
jgi:hypothetical protein